MSIPSAYIAVIAIWATTPLGIVWSTESFPATFAVFARMAIALVICWSIVCTIKVRVPWSKPAMNLYTYSSIGIVGGMLLSYVASLYISSGMMSLIFGLSPIISGVLAQIILKSSGFTPSKKIALAFAIIGLAIVCSPYIDLNNVAWKGLVTIFMAVTLFSLSGVLVKTVAITIHPIATTTGALTLSVPVFAVIWLMVTQGQWLNTGLQVSDITLRSIYSVMYLGIFGSVVGFVAYFYVLQKLTAQSVALITLITPSFAIVLGACFNNEVVSLELYIGASLIIFALAIYQFADHLIFKMTSKKPTTNTLLE